MRDTRCADAMGRTMDAIVAALAEVDAEIPKPIYPLHRRILWKFCGVPYEVSAEARRIGKERSDLYLRALHERHRRNQ